MTQHKLILVFALLLLWPHHCVAQELPSVQTGVSRPWVGPEFWTNPLMNWKLSEGRIENTHGGWVNEVHSLTHQLKEGDGSFQVIFVRLGLLENSSGTHRELGFAGFKFGAVGHRNDYRANILHGLQNGFCRELMQQPPVKAGIVSDGRLLVGSRFSDQRLTAEQMKNAFLKLDVKAAGSNVQTRLIVLHADQEILVLEATLQRDALLGNVAIACHGLNPPETFNRDGRVIDHARFWFSDWQLSGDKVEASPGQAIGPILWTQYTLHENTLKLMAFFVPMEETANKTVELQIRSGDAWKTVAQSEIEPLSRTALFRVDAWNSSRDFEYRVTYRWQAVAGESLATWSGTVRKDPVDKDTIILAALSCSNSDLFPNRFLTQNLLAQDPDLVFFSGDQIYEANGGYFTVVPETKSEVERGALNYLGKFWLSILGFRDLLKDRPTVMVPDDHDLYSNDLWGKGGMPMGDGRCFGGYRGHVDWINMIEYTQMGNRPDPSDATPIEQGIRVYTTSLDVGGVSFALINDRKFKSAPGDVVDAMEPLFKIRGQRNLRLMDTINEQDFDTRTLDRDDLQLLGARQLTFLREWGKSDAKLRAVLSQSAFCQPHHLMVADMDSNGWPQSGRRRALEVIRDAGAIMVTGDLHFPTLVQQGTDNWEDAGWSFTVPSVSTNTHRAWRPKKAGENRQPGMPEYTGRFLDGWGNKITMWAAANPHSFTIEDPYRGDGVRTLAYIRATAQGYGLVKFHKSEDSVTFESWPVYGEFKHTDQLQQHPGFPKTVKVR